MIGGQSFEATLHRPGDWAPTVNDTIVKLMDTSVASTMKWRKIAQ